MNVVAAQPDSNNDCMTLYTRRNFDHNSILEAGSIFKTQYSFYYDPSAGSPSKITYIKLSDAAGGSSQCGTAPPECPTEAPVTTNEVVSTQSTLASSTTESTGSSTESISTESTESPQTESTSTESPQSTEATTTAEPPMTLGGDDCSPFVEVKYPQSNGEVGEIQLTVPVQLVDWTIEVNEFLNYDTRFWYIDSTSDKVYFRSMMTGKTLSP